MFKQIIAILSILSAAPLPGAPKCSRYLWVVIKNDDAKKALEALKKKKFDHYKKGTEKNPPEGKTFLFKFEGEEDVVYKAEVKDGRFEWIGEPYLPYEVINYCRLQDDITTRTWRSLTYNNSFFAYKLSDEYYFIFMYGEQYTAKPVFVSIKNDGLIKLIGKNPIEFAKKLIENLDYNYKEFCSPEPNGTNMTKLSNTIKVG